MRSIAGRIHILTELLNPPISDEEGNTIGYGEPFITMEEAVKLLELPTYGTRNEHQDYFGQKTLVT